MTVDIKRKRKSHAYIKGHTPKYSFFSGFTVTSITPMLPVISSRFTQ